MQHSLAALRATGWTACVVEQTIPVPGRSFKRDAFGFGDILACNEELGVLLVQTTAGGGHVAKHVEKFEKDPAILAAITKWLRAGGGFYIHSWALRGGRGEPKRITAKVWKVTGAVPGLVLLQEPDIRLAELLKGRLVSTAERVRASA